MNQTFVIGKRVNDQPRFSQNKECVHWKIFQVLKYWQIVKTFLPELA